MKYNQPYGVSDPNAPYINGDPSLGRAGSIPPAASIEYPQRELVNYFADSGLTPDNADLHQLSRAHQSHGVIYAVDTSSTVNLVTLSLTPPLITYYSGLTVWALIKNTNSGPAQVNINSMGALAIVRRGGAALETGDLIADSKALLTYNQRLNKFELYGTNYAPASGVQWPVMTQNMHLYVNAATGNDTLYDGTTATISGVHGPFKTIGRAITETWKYGPSVYTMTIHVAAGSYPEYVAPPQVLGPRVIIEGQDKTNTFITGANNANTIWWGAANQVTVKKCCISTGVWTAGRGTPSAFLAYNNATIYTEDCATAFVDGAVFGAWTGQVYPGQHTFNANSQCDQVLSALFNSMVYILEGVTWTFLGPLTCAVFAAAGSGGNCVVGAAPPLPVVSFVNPGFVTGQKFSADANGIVYTGGQSVNFFPGTVAGTATRNGWYI
jgi:hypothetical protein